LEAWKRSIRELPQCREFHETMLADSPTCRSCMLRPAQKNVNLSADQMLASLDDRLDDMLTRWRQALRANLTNEAVQHSLTAMSPKEQKPIEDFLAQNDEDVSIPEGFASAASQALRGIESITLPVDDLLQALKTGGLPCTVDELQRRFAEYIHKTMRGHDASSTRLTLDK